MTVWLRASGHQINGKHVQRLLRKLGLAGMAPGLHTSKLRTENKVYPYLLGGLAVIRPQQVWSTDITYVRLATENRDFLEYVKLVKQFYQTGEARLTDWDVPKTED